MFREAEDLTFQGYVEATRAPDEAVRRDAVVRLAALLAHRDPAVRRKAVHVLNEMGGAAEPAWHALGEARNDPDREVRGTAGSALEKIFEAVARADAARTRERIVALATGYAVAAEGAARRAARTREALAPHVRDLNAPEPEDRIKALNKIAAFGPDADSVGGRVIEAMQDKVAAVQSAAGRALEQISPNVHPQVVALLRGPKKRESITALGELGAGAEIAIPLLLKCNDNVFLWGAGTRRPGSTTRTCFQRSRRSPRRTNGSRTRSSGCGTRCPCR